MQPAGLHLPKAPAASSSAPTQSAASIAAETSSTKTNSRLAALVLGNLLDVALVALGDDHPLDPGPLGRQRLLLEAADRQHLAGQRHLAGHRDFVARPAGR